MAYSPGSLSNFCRITLRNDMASISRTFTSTFVTFTPARTTTRFYPDSQFSRIKYSGLPHTRPSKIWNVLSSGYCTNPTRPSASFFLRDLSERRLTMAIKASQGKIVNKFNSIYKSYEQMSHTTDIREAHQHVEQLQEELKLAQDRRRDISKELSDIRYELQLIYADLVNCKKGEPRYLELVRKEYEIYHREKQKLSELDLQDKAERDLFIHLQAAVKTSHEKEKIHTNSAKYWSIVGSLLGALLGICGTAFSFYNRSNTVTSMLAEVKSEFGLLRDDTKDMNREIKKLIELNNNMMLAMQNEKIQKRLTNNETKLSWAAWSWSWTQWIGNKTGVVSIYRYIIPKQM